MLLYFLHDDSAQGLVEYALVVTLVSIAAISSLHFLGQKANNHLNNAASRMP